MFRSWCFTVHSLPCWGRCDSGGIHLVSPLEIPFYLEWQVLCRCGGIAMNQNFTPSFVWWQELRRRFFIERHALGASRLNSFYHVLFGPHFTISCPLVNWELPPDFYKLELNIMRQYTYQTALKIILHERRMRSGLGFFKVLLLEAVWAWGSGAGHPGFFQPSLSMIFLSGCSQAE